MQLQDYLAREKLSPAAFGEKVGASEFGVRKWMRGERIPRAETMRKIAEATGGQVTATDFFTDIGEAAQ